MPTYDPSFDATGYDDSSVTNSGYAASLEEVAPNITTMIGEQQQPGESWTDSLARLLPIIAATEQQRQLLNVQIDRAKQGLPPLNVSQYAAGVQVGVSSDVKNLLILGGLGALAILAVGASRRR